ncbi:MAG: hypothetical protein AABX96_01580 [Nanoarchaeota archaeon]
MVFNLSPESIKDKKVRSALIKKVKIHDENRVKVSKEEIVNQSLIKAEQLRKSILKSAFEGKLVKTKNINIS